MPAGEHPGLTSGPALTRQRALSGSATLASILVLLTYCLAPAIRVDAGEIAAKQGAGVLLLSSADPEEPDIAAMIEEIRAQIQEGSQDAVHFTLEYLGPS